MTSVWYELKKVTFQYIYKDSKIEPLKQHASLKCWVRQNTTVTLKYLVHSCSNGLRKIQSIAVVHSCTNGLRDGLIQVQSIAVLMDLEKFRFL